jgi:hypothetical protein
MLISERVVGKSNIILYKQAMSETSKYDNIGRLLIIGLLFHCVFIASVFDTYFTSPVVHGMTGYNLTEAESKRLVLIVGMGQYLDQILWLMITTCR